MTAMNAFARHDGAYLIADTARYLADGTVEGFASKIAYSNRLKLMVGHSGMPGPNCHANLQAHLDGAPSQDEARDGIPALLRDLQEDADDLFAMQRRCDDRAIARGVPADSFMALRAAGLRLTLAWWDRESGRGRCAAIASKQDFLAPGIGAYEWRSFSTIFSPVFEGDPWPGNNFTPLEHCDDLARLQRCAPMSDGIHMVGGRMELFRVSDVGVEGFPVTAWPDEIGRKIDTEAEPIARELLDAA